MDPYQLKQAELTIILHALEHAAEHAVLSQSESRIASVREELIEQHEHHDDGTATTSERLLPAGGDGAERVESDVADGDGDAPDTQGDSEPQVDSRDELTLAEREVLDAVAVVGEAAGSDIQLESGRGDATYTHLNHVIDYGLVDNRKDPDDGRRRLYSLTEFGDQLAEPDTNDESTDGELTTQAAAAGGGGSSDGDGIDPDDPFGELWLDEGSFWAAVEESADLHELHATLGWQREEDGPLVDLVEVVGAETELGLEEGEVIADD